jgi:hypothetical protein
MRPVLYLHEQELQLRDPEPPPHTRILVSISQLKLPYMATRHGDISTRKSLERCWKA